jgi:hypothetical protein
MSASGTYLLGDSPAEITHLVEQAEVYAEEANELFDLIRPPAGGAAIDLGCGVLGVLHLLAERLGTDGRVVGVDREARIVKAGRTLASSAAWPSSSSARTPPTPAYPIARSTWYTRAPCCSTSRTHKTSSRT